AATSGVILRPFRWPEAVWAVLGAVALVLLGLLPLADAWRGVVKGFDVYLFLIGMMLLAEMARIEGLFDWLASFATAHADGSATRLYLLVYAVGTVVTVLLSNDATAIVLTPAVYAAARAAKVSNPLPYLLICAFIANAASFALPISNPANLVVYGAGHMPPLATWLRIFLLPSVGAVLVTYIMLRFSQAHALRSERLTSHAPRPELSKGGMMAGIGIILAAIVLVCTSAFGFDLGLPTFVSGLICLITVLAATRRSPLDALRGVSWSIIPLVAGLFVLVEALQKIGIVHWLASTLDHNVASSPQATAMLSGSLAALVSNLANNLPVGLLAGGALRQAHASSVAGAAVLIGVDLGPNLSVTGSLATILWLAALRREGFAITSWQFLKLGVVVMVPALTVALALLALESR
ncbi:MAG TPA: arsenic transporter, partial [Xanthobacteraceae bacterium]|nr:arsenic transporter [Xanthobacteraceae bacterium]